MPHTSPIGRRSLRFVLGLAALLVASGIPTASIVSAGVINGRAIELVTSDWEPVGHKEGARISGDGSLVAFTALAEESPFAASGSSGRQVYARDLGTGQVEQISVDSDEGGYVGMAFAGGMTPDGRFVTFSDWQHPYTGLYLDAYLRDRQLGVTEVISVAHDGGPSDGYTQVGDIDISADGRYVVFSSNATNLVPEGDTNGADDVYLRDRVAGTTERLSVAEGGGETLGDSRHPRISADGSTVVFESQAPNLTSDGSSQGVFALDLGSRTLERVSVSTAGASGDSSSGSCASGVSSDGRIVAFVSEATNLVDDDTNFVRDVFVRDRDAGTTVRASVTDSEAEGPFFGGFDGPSMNADGTKVVFASDTALDPDLGSGPQAYLRDLTAGTTTLISASAAGVGADGYSGYCFNVQGIDIDDAGSVIAFASTATDLLDAPDPVAGYFDVFVSRPASGDPDVDGDGISDDVDLDATTASGSFSDGTTFGHLTSVPAGFAVAVTDAIDPDRGVRVLVTGVGAEQVVMSACDETIHLPAGADAIVTCGSVIVEVAAGSPPIAVVLGGGLGVVSVPPGGSAEVSAGAGGSFLVENVTGGNVSVTVDGVTTTVEPGENFNGAAWDFQGFASPIDNSGTLNVSTAGRAVPVRWRLIGGDGRPVTDLAMANLTVTSLPCGLATTSDQVEEYAAGASGLLNLGNGNYQINWKTPKAYAGSCKTLRLEIGDGVFHEARIKFVN